MGNHAPVHRTGPEQFSSRTFQLRIFKLQSDSEEGNLSAFMVPDEQFNAIAHLWLLSLGMSMNSEYIVPSFVCTFQGLALLFLFFSRFQPPALETV